KMARWIRRRQATDSASRARIPRSQEQVVPSTPQADQGRRRCGAWRERCTLDETRPLVLLVRSDHKGRERQELVEAEPRPQEGSVDPRPTLAQQGTNSEPLGQRLDQPCQVDLAPPNPRSPKPRPTPVPRKAPTSIHCSREDPP